SSGPGDGTTMRKPNRFSSGETSMKRTPWFTLILALLAVATLSVPVAAAQTGTVPLLGGIRDGSVYLFGAAGTEPVQVFQGGDMAFPTQLKWTPDGQHLLFLATAP